MYPPPLLTQNLILTALFLAYFWIPLCVLHNSDIKELESSNVISIFLVLTEIGSSSRAYCELAGRVEPFLGDVVVSLIEMGISLEGLERHARRNHRLILPALAPAAQPKQLAILQAGQKLPHPSHIPTHLPAFPDPHAYIRTPVSGTNALDYHQVL
jgi:hypothetical protein